MTNYTALPIKTDTQEYYLIVSDEEEQANQLRYETLNKCEQQEITY